MYQIKFEKETHEKEYGSHPAKTIGFKINVFGVN